MKQNAVAGHVLNSQNQKEWVMKGFALRLLSILTLAITAGLAWLPSVALAGITLNGID